MSASESLATEIELDNETEDAESRAASAYPPSVQPGIPKLGRKPDGWTRAPIGEFLEPIFRPAKLADNERYQLVTARRSRGGIVPREVLFGRDIRTKTQFFVKAGDFLISKRQISHGACGIVPTSLDSAVVSNEYVALKPKAGLDVRFLNHLSHSVYFQQTCFHSSIGVHIEKLVFKLEDWLEWEFDIPPIAEQLYLADAFDSWDRAITQTDKLIGAKRRFQFDLIQSIFRPATDPDSHVSNDWAPCLISDLADVVGGGTPSTAEAKFWGGDIPWCTPTDLAGLPSRYINATERMITAEGLNASSATLLPARSVILCSRASVGECAINTFPMSTNQGFQSLVPHSSEDVLFLYYMVRALKRRLLQISAGSTFQEFSRTELRALYVAAPPPERRASIGSALAQLDNEIDILKACSAHLKEQKRGLMQLLLGGDVHAAKETAE